MEFEAQAARVLPKFKMFKYLNKIKQFIERIRIRLWPLEKAHRERSSAEEDTNWMLKGRKALNDGRSKHVLSVALEGDCAANIHLVG